MQQATRQPARRHGRPARDAAVGPGRRVGVDRHHRADLDDQRRPRPCPTARRSRSPAPRPTPAAASWPASRSRPTAAAPGTRRPAPRAGPTPGPPTATRRRRSRRAPSTTAATCRRPAPASRSTSPARARSGARAPVPTAGRRLGRPDRGRGRRQVQVRQLRRHHRPPLLQGRGQHRHPHRQPVDRRRARARPGDLHRRDGVRLADRDLRHSGPGPAGHHLRRVLLRAQRPLRGHGRLLLPQPRARAERRRHQPTARPCTPSATPAPTTNGVYAYAASSTFPTNSFGAANYWVDVIFSPTPAPGAGDERERRRRRHDLRERDVVGAVERRRRDLLQDHARTSARRAQTPTTINGSPPANAATITGLTTGTTYTFTVQAHQPERLRPGVGAVQRR